jgi:hypothetical protein
VRCGTTVCGSGVNVGFVSILLSASLSDNGDGVEYNAAFVHETTVAVAHHCCILGTPVEDRVDWTVRGDDKCRFGRFVTLHGLVATHASARGKGQRSRPTYSNEATLGNDCPSIASTHHKQHNMDGVGVKKVRIETPQWLSQETAIAISQMLSDWRAWK